MADFAEHRIQMPPAHPGVSASPEKRLNRFVHCLALVERLGNALGTLAFTWATVVLLGGYPTVLRPRSDFWFATTIVLLEAIRMFSRSNRLDYQLFFRTRGAFRSLGWNGLILLVCFFNVCLCVRIWSKYDIIRASPLLVAVLAVGPFLCLDAARLLICNSVQRVMSLWSPFAAVILLGPCILYTIDDGLNIHRLSFKDSIAKVIVYLVLLVIVLLVVISRLQFPCIIKLVDCYLGIKIVFWRRVILNLCMLAVIAMSATSFEGYTRVGFIILYVPVLVIVSFGNLQIPAALLRIVLALMRLVPQSYYGEHVDKTDLGDKTNLAPSLNIFYAMVLGQGILYILACILEVFSFILRRSLARRAGFIGPRGLEFVNLYYGYAFEKCIGGAVLAPKKISLVTFAMDSLKSDSPKMQLYGLQMMHSFLKREPLKTKAMSKLTNSMQMVTSLFNMLGWKSEGDEHIRSSAAKVIAELADSLRVVLVPGAMQLIASLLDTVHRHKIKDPLLDICSPMKEQDDQVQLVGRDEQISPMLKWLKQMAAYSLIPREEPSSMEEQNSHVLRCWKHFTKYWSVPEEGPSTDQDILPSLALLILDKLASFDLENCIEMSRTTGLISKIIEFTSNRTDMTNINETHQTLLKGSALKLLRRLASTKGKFGVTLRQKIAEHPFLLSNLAEILDDSGSSQELRELTAELLRNLALDGNIKEEIGHTGVIISTLMHAFLSQGATSSNDSDQLLRMIAGQALAVMAMESANNCLVMLAEPGYVFIKELTIMIHDDRYRYVASSLLRNMFVHARPELGNSDLKEVSYILREVLEGIMDAEGAELEILVGLSSQICYVIPEDFSRELEHGQIKDRFIQSLVNALHSNMIPAAHCPGIRRLIVEHAIYMIEYDPSCIGCFNKYWMMEALLKIERTPSRAENYRIFLGDAGLMEHIIPISALVAKLKELIGPEWLRGIRNVT